jgi:2-polyprenyl-6-methoxyphenol hydroxylase-like FAD-dependent oxidoreductase
MRETADVAIVGCGPVGAALAILLGQRGWRVRVLERWPQPYPLPRAVHLDHEAMRVLQAAGVTAELAPRTEAASVYEWRNARRELLLQIGRDAGASLSGWPESNMFCQPELEAILEARLRALPSVALQRGLEVTSVSDAGPGALLRARSAAGAELELEARYAVGCDGAQSLVRGALGAAWSDLGFHFDWLVVDVIPGDPRRWDPLNWQLCDPTRPTTLVSGGPGRRRFEFMRLPHETREELEREERVWRLLAPWEVHPGNAKLERFALYTFRACQADRWRSGRLFVAGDAAHLMPPFAGQGLCAGLRDAANLAWKLDQALAGRAGDALLDSYQSERAPHVRAVTLLSIELGKVICVADLAEAAARDRRMLAEQAARTGPASAPLPPLGPGCFADESPGARTLSVQDRVRAGARSGLFDDVVGRGFALVSPHADPAGQLAPELRAWFASLPGISAHVAPDGPVEDRAGAYARWFAQHGAGVALVRPDFQVFGSAPTLEGANALVGALRREIERS